MRPVKLEFYDHPFDDSRRKCPSCKGELQIHEGMATAISDKKPPKRAIVESPKRSRK